MKRFPSISEIVKIINIPTRHWESNCYGIICKIVAKEIIKGIAVYGALCYSGLSTFILLDNRKHILGE